MFAIHECETSFYLFMFFPTSLNKLNKKYHIPICLLDIVVKILNKILKKIKSNKTFKKLYTIIKHSLLMGSKPVLTSENQLM